MTTDKAHLLKCVWENDTDKPANWSAFCLTLSSKQVFPSFFFPHTVISLLSLPLYSAISPLFSLSCLPWPIRLDATSESCVECIYECCEPLNEKYWQLLFFPFNLGLKRWIIHCRDLYHLSVPSVWGRSSLIILRQWQLLQTQTPWLQQKLAKQVADNLSSDTLMYWQDRWVEAQPTSLRSPVLLTQIYKETVSVWRP